MDKEKMLDVIPGALADMGLVERGSRVLLSEDGTKVYLDVRGKFTSMSTYALLALLDTARTAHGEKII